MDTVKPDCGCVGAWLRERRQGAGLTQGTIAAAVGTSQTGVSKMELGARRVSLTEAVQFANACGASDEDWIALRRLAA